MLHLLTEEHKKKVSKEYARRVWIVVSVIITALLFVSFAFLYPTYRMSHGRYAEILDQKKDIDTKIAVRQNDTSVDSVASISTSISALRMFNNEQDPATLITTLLAQKPKGVAIVRISYQSSPKAGVTRIELSGKSDTREHLVLFSQQVKNSKLFINVDVPLSSFAREKDIDFSMRVTVGTSTQATTLQHEK